MTLLAISGRCLEIIWEGVSPRGPKHRGCHPCCRSQSQSSKMHWDRGDFLRTSLLNFIPGQPSEDLFHCLHHAGVMASRVPCWLGGRQRPQEVVALWAGTLEEELTTALKIWQPRDCLPQLFLFGNAFLAQPLNEFCTANWSSKTLDVFMTPH